MTSIAIVALLSLLRFPLSAEAGHEDAGLACAIEQHYPAELSAFAQFHHLTENRQQAYVELEIAHVSYVVVAYTGGYVGAVVLMSRSSSGAYVVDQEIVGHGQEGKDPFVDAVDVDGDHNAEVVVRFHLPRGADTAIYRIINHHMEVISPMEDGISRLGYPAILDLGNGKKDLIDVHMSGDLSDPTIGYYHYALRQGQYVESTKVYFYYVFNREAKRRNTRMIRFPIPASLIGKRFAMTIVNGESDGKDRADHIRVTLNGVKLKSANDDNSKHRKAWTVPVTLRQDNMIAVELSGNPRGQVAIVVQHK